MHKISITFAAACLATCALSATAHAESPDPRLREVWYDPQAVVTVQVKRGIVTHVVLDPGEAITDLGSGLKVANHDLEIRGAGASRPTRAGETSS